MGISKIGSFKKRYLKKKLMLEWYKNFYGGNKNMKKFS